MFAGSKLVELRRKTDRDLVILVRNTLDRALTLAEVATSRQSPLYARAERAYELANVLLPLISGLSQDQFLELESKLRQLCTALDSVSRARSKPACATAER